MAKNFNVGVSALSELGRAKLDEADAALGAARTWLSAAVQEAKQSIEELCPAAKRQCTRRRAAKPVIASDPCDKENQLPPPSRTRAAAGRRAKRGLALALETVTEEEEQPSCQLPSADKTAHANLGPEAAAIQDACDAGPAESAAEAAPEEVPAPESAVPAGRATRRRKGAKAAAPAAVSQESPADAASLAASNQQVAAAAPASRRRGRGAAKALPSADDDAASSLASSLATPAPNSRATRSTRARAAASAEPLTSLRSPPRTRARAGRRGRGAAASATPAEPVEQPTPPQSATQEAAPGSGLPNAAAARADIAVPRNEVDVQTAAIEPFEDEAGVAALYSPTVDAAVADFVAEVAEEILPISQLVAEDEVQSLDICSEAQAAIAEQAVEARISPAQPAEAREAVAASPDADVHAAAASPQAGQAAAVPGTEQKSASPPTARQSVSPALSADVADIAAAAVSDDEQPACAASPAEAAAHASPPLEATMQAAAHVAEDTAAAADVPASVSDDTGLPEGIDGDNIEDQPSDTADAEVGAAPRVSRAQPVSSPAAAEQDLEVDLGSPALPDAAVALAAVADPSPHAAVCPTVVELPAADDVLAAAPSEVDQTVIEPKASGGLAANLVSTIRSFLPMGAAKPALPPGAGKKPVKVKALEVAEAARRKEAAKAAERANQRAALEQQRADRQKRTLEAKARVEEDARARAEEARVVEDARRKAYDEALARRRAVEAEEKRAREERLRRAEEVRAKRKQEEARKKAEEEAAWAAAQKEADTRRLAEEERRRKAERTGAGLQGRPMKQLTARQPDRPAERPAPLDRPSSSVHTTLALGGGALPAVQAHTPTPANSPDAQGQRATRSTSMAAVAMRAAAGVASGACDALLRSLSSGLGSEPRVVSLAATTGSISRPSTPLRSGSKSHGQSQSYEISPYKSDHGSDSDDEDCGPRKPVPDWARGKALIEQLALQVAMDPDEVFQQHKKTCSLDEVFTKPDPAAKKAKDFSRRTSSGNWINDRVTWKEELNYKKAMGYM